MAWRESWALVSVLLAAGCGGGGSEAEAPPSSRPSPSPGTSQGPSPAPSPTPAQPAAPAPSPAPVSSPEGFYVGTTSTGYAFNVLVLEDRQVWGVYGQSGLAHGAVQGQVTVSGTTFSGAARDFYIFGGEVFDITLAGSFTPLASISGTIAGANPGTFSAAYAPQYDQPANPADLAGTWTATAVSSTGTTTNTVTVDVFGNITASNVFCTMTGTGLPRASGKNVFNVSLTFAGPSCLFEGQTLSGVAVVLNNAGVRDLTIAALLPDRSDGFLATARR